MIAEFPSAFSELFKPHRYKVYYGGRGAGKSQNIGRALLLIAANRPITVLCTREIQNSISDSVHKLLREQIDELGLSRHFTVTNHSIYGANGSEFIFKGLRHNVREIKSTEGVDICWVEEAASVSAESWDVLIPTIRAEGSEIWVSFNPVDEHDPTYQRFVISPPDNAYVKKVNYDENPYFPQVLRDEMEWLKKRDYEDYLHVWEGEPRKISNAIVFSGRFKVESFETPSNARFYQGADWGFSSDPTTLIRCYVDNGTLFIDREAWGVGVDIDETPALFDTIDTARRWPIKADCARPETISYMRRQGFNISAAKKWAGSIEDGIEFIKTFDIVIHPRCRHIIDEFNRYSYKIDSKTNEVLPIIVDKYNHCLVAGTMITTINGDKPIETIKPGELVLTRKGYCPVKWQRMTRHNAKVYNIVGGAYSITGTDNHKVWIVEKGWTEIKDVRKGDKLLCIPKLSKRTALNGTDTQRVKDVQTENILNVEMFGYTATRGNSITALFRRDIMFITKTAIAKTTKLITSKLCALKNTVENIRWEMNDWKTKENCLTAFAHLPKNGTEVRKVLSGIKSTHKQKTLDTLNMQGMCATIAGKSLLLERKDSVSVPMLANRHGEGRRDLITSQKSALFAGKNLPQADILREFVVQEVAHVKESGIADVYDIEVCGEHEFFANGILVHNCIDALRYSLDGLIKGRGSMKINPRLFSNIR
jgi:phage terminase large subunit